MRPVYQTKFGGSDAPEEEQGNCMQACLASIFEIPLEDAPEFTGLINSGAWFTHLQAWLKKRNLTLLMLPAKPVDIPHGFAMAGVLSKTLPKPEDGHMIVVQNGLPVHDPNPANKDVSPEDYTMTEYWVFTCIDPSKMKEER
jgi:hypothetical protein